MKSTLLVSMLAVALSAAVLSRQQPSESHAALTAAGADAASENGQSRRLCRLLGKLALEVQQTSSVGARAQLVASIDAVFGDDPAVLAQLAISIDEAAIEHCPLARNELLSVLQIASLKEAVRAPSGRAPSSASWRR